MVSFVWMDGVFFSRKMFLSGIEPAPSLLRTQPSQLGYVTLVVTRPALELGSVRTSGSLFGSFLPKKLNLFWFWPIHIFYRGKHVLILTISMQTWRFLLKRVWSAGAPRIFAPARTPQKPQIFGKGIFAVLLYNLQSNYYCLIAPPLDLTYLILSRT